MLLLSFTVISGVYRSFITNKTTFTKYFLTEWIPKFPGSFEIRWVRQYLVNFTGLADIANKIVQDRANFHRSRVWQIVLIFHTVMIIVSFLID